MAKLAGGARRMLAQNPTFLRAALTGGRVPARLDEAPVRSCGSNPRRRGRGAKARPRWAAPVFPSAYPCRTRAFVLELAARRIEPRSGPERLRSPICLLDGGFWPFRRLVR